jgi:hypothetical protein
MSDVYVIKVTLGGEDNYLSENVFHDEDGRVMSTTGYQPNLSVATRWISRDAAKRRCERLLHTGFGGQNARLRVVRVRSVKKSGG